MRKVLVLGGTGVMGSYLIPRLLKLGFIVDTVSLDNKQSQDSKLRYFMGNAKDLTYLNELVKNDYDAIVDFMIYSTPEFAARCNFFLENTQHYIYLSSYRVYADSKLPITENSPRLLDVSMDKDYLASDDYSLHKARGENALIASGKKNWTVVRPTITYSSQRLQLITLEGNTIINRSRKGKPVVLPREALLAQTTMTWGGDVAEMIARLVLNNDAYGESYTVATAEHQPWETVAKYYQKFIGLKYIAVGMDEFLSIQSDEPYDNYRWKLIYDRIYDRVIDNNKILNITGLKQSELKPLFVGLEESLQSLDKNKTFGNMDYSARMDTFIEKNKLTW